jgi:hypothetical protein
MRSSEFHQAEVGKVPIATYTFHYRSTRMYLLQEPNPTLD